MKKLLKSYKVIQTSIHDYGDGNVQKYEKIHYTKAVSEAQARSRVMHRLGYNKYNCVVDWFGGGYRMEDFKAKVIE